MGKIKREWYVKNIVLNSINNFSFLTWVHSLPYKVQNRLLSFQKSIYKNDSENLINNSNNVFDNFDVIGFMFNFEKSNSFDSLLVCKKSDFKIVRDDVWDLQNPKNDPSYFSYFMITSGYFNVPVPVAKFNNEEALFRIKRSLFFTDDFLKKNNVNLPEIFIVDSSLKPEFLKACSVYSPEFFLVFMIIHNHFFKEEEFMLNNNSRSSYDLYIQSIIVYSIKLNFSNFWSVLTLLWGGHCYYNLLESKLFSKFLKKKIINGKSYNIYFYDPILYLLMSPFLSYATSIYIFFSKFIELYNINLEFHVQMFTIFNLIIFYSLLFFVNFTNASGISVLLVFLYLIILIFWMKKKNWW
jgi:hypothetical protein